MGWLSRGGGLGLRVGFFGVFGFGVVALGRLELDEIATYYQVALRRPEP